jgi:hypothetical protein
MWTVRSQAPIWLIVSYCGAVFIVFGFIAYIILQLIKLRKLGTEQLNEKRHD